MKFHAIANFSFCLDLSVRQRIGLVRQLISQFVYISYDRVGSSKSPSDKNRQKKRIGGLSLTHECKLVYSLVNISYFVTFKLMLNQA